MTELALDYREVLASYGYGKNDRFISRMFINNSNGSKKSSTYHFQVDELITELANCHKDDLYMSMNDFNAPSRKEENVHSLKHLYVDLDTYHSDYANLPYCNEQIMALLEENFYGKKFPVPNLTISSGRGLYLIWNIQEHKNALPRWKTVQKYLCNLLKEFGADPKVATDAARVLRVPGSLNTKSGKYVTILQKNEDKHSLYEFLDLYMPDSYMKGIRTHEEIRKLKKESKSIKTNENNKKLKVNAKMECKIASYHSQKTLMEARLSDLETLLTQYRDKEHGSKEYIFFLYRMWALNLYKDSKVVNSMILQLNAKLRFQADSERILAETRSAETYYNDKKIRNMKNETIISFLSITENEMMSLKTIISKEEAKRRKALRNKDAYNAKLERNNDIRKKDKIILRYEKIAAYREQGLQAKEISELLGQSYRQTLRDLKNIEEYRIDYTGQNTNETSNDKDFNEISNNEITPVLNTEETVPTKETNHNFTFTITSQNSYIYYVTNIKPYLLQDVVHSSFTRTLYVTSYMIYGFFTEDFYYDSD